MIQPVTYKQVLDKDGALTFLELWQGNKYITISLGAETPRPDGTKWVEIQETVNKLQEMAHKQALDRTMVQ